MWKEYSRRCESDADEAPDLDLSEFVVFVAELAGELDGEDVFCTACWTPFMPHLYAYEITRESLFSYLVNPEQDDGGHLEAVRAGALYRVEADEDYDGPYAGQFRTLVQMLDKKAAESGFRTEDYDHSDDLDDL